MAKQSTAAGLRYRGLGHIAGIPARDLTAEEVEQFGGLAFLSSRQNGHGGKMFEKVKETKPVGVNDGIRNDSIS